MRAILMRTAVFLIALSITSPVLAGSEVGANERVGFLVRRLVDACVGTVVVERKLEALVRAGRTATGVCTCAAETEVGTGSLFKGEFDSWVTQPGFKQRLGACANAEVH
jgi:hypothetical protein